MRSLAARRCLLVILGLGLALAPASCGRGPANRKPTYPVRGEVYVDGKPAGQLAVYCVELRGIDEDNPTSSATFTDDAGKFAISTYLSGDGVPEGEYALTFFWGQYNLITRSYGGPDKLKNRYTDSKQSKVRLTVVKGKLTDLGRIDLTTR
jgi:hypothetical protein